MLKLKMEMERCVKMAEKIDRTNEIGVNNNGERMIIIRYGYRRDIDVQFDDGTIVEHRAYKDFLKGSIRNPMTPSLFGVGFIGKGRFKPHDGNGKPTKCYEVWKDMLRRCYDSKYQEKKPTYKGCRVCQEWWNFQKFAEWYYSHFYEIEGQIMNLDKDILCKGNKVYSANTCVFVPVSINVLFIKSNKARGECPIGVSKVCNKFQAHLNKYNKLIHLGTYDTPKEAFLAYKQAKEDYIKQIAEEYKLLIPLELYEAMINYEVEIDD